MTRRLPSLLDRGRRLAINLQQDLSFSVSEGSHSFVTKSGAKTKALLCHKGLIYGVSTGDKRTVDPMIHGASVPMTTKDKMAGVQSPTTHSPPFSTYANLLFCDHQY